MNTTDSKQNFSRTWLTLTELSVLFGQCSQEMSLHLEELGLRTFDTERHQHLPSTQAYEQGLCMITSSRRRNLSYLWHQHKVSVLLEERLHLQILSAEDRHARSLALQLLRYCKKQRHMDTGIFDPLRDIFFAPDIAKIIAWYIHEEGKRAGPVGSNARNLLTLMNGDHAGAINQELERLGSDGWMGELSETEMLYTQVPP